MNDILPPHRRRVITGQPQAATVPPSQPTPDAILPPPVPVSQPQFVEVSPQPAETPPPEPRSRRRIPRWLWWAIGCMVVVIAAVAAAAVYYQHELQPVSTTAQATTRVTVVPDSSPSQIGKLLYDKQLIRSTTIFDIYTRLNRNRNKLQAGTYNLSPRMSLPEIIDHLVSGKTDTMRIQFLPGAALWPDPRVPENKRVDIETTLINVGFHKADVDAALTKQYDHPLMQGRPAGSDIEGYVYGDSYEFNADASLDDVFNKVFDTYYAALQKNNIIAALQQENLTLYQGITLASIVETEMGSSDPSTASHDQQQVAQVFMLRLARGMPLGSDVTAYYGAIKAGQTPAVTVDTPYNTRLHAGLPPGPIATPSLGALEAVAHPAAGDYLFFLNGDDGVMYYARTDAEHQANIKAHCQQKCSVS